jgi:hypothetical protein
MSDPRPSVNGFREQVAATVWTPAIVREAFEMRAAGWPIALIAETLGIGELRVARVVSTT